MDKQEKTIREYRTKVDSLCSQVQKDIAEKAKDIGNDILALMLLYKASKFKELPKDKQKDVKQKLIELENYANERIEYAKTQSVNLADKVFLELSLDFDTSDYESENDAYKFYTHRDIGRFGNEIELLGAFAILSGWSKKETSNNLSRNIMKIYKMDGITSLKQYKPVHFGSGVSKSSIQQLDKTIRATTTKEFYDYMGYGFLNNGYVIKTKTTSFAPCQYCIDSQYEIFYESPLPFHIHCVCIPIYIKKESLPN